MNTINLNLTKNKKVMKPMIYGHFVEFMRDCIDEGMWAQLLKNRGFDKAKEIPAGVVDGNPHVAWGWYRTGFKNGFTIRLDAGESLARDGYAQMIRCYNDYDGYVGIAQKGLCFHKKEYEGYIWMKSAGNAEIALLVSGSGGEVLMERRLCPDEEWNKYEFGFVSGSESGDGVFEIRLLGEGTVWLDGASIMPADHVAGIWTDVMRYIKELHPPVIRYPGGCFADCYHFEDGIGAIDTRPYRMNRHWGGYTDNSFGTDEYMMFCREVGCEPMICVNFGSGTPEEAAAWVEYCNGGTDTPYGRLRAENGHPEPYNIKYWDIGNEIFGDWEIGHSNAREYANRYLEFYKEMKAKDDSIVFMVCGGDGDERSQEWNRTVAEIVKHDMDAVCLHMYALKDVAEMSYANEDIYYAVVGAVKKYEEVLGESYETVNRDGGREILVAVTEYNLGTLIDSYREQTLEAAIFNAGMLNMFMRNCDRLLMCNYSDLVNGWPGGCIVSRNGQAYGTASYYVLQLYAEADIQEIVMIETELPVYNTKEQIGNIEPLREVSLVDIVAGISGAGEWYLFAVNRSLDEEILLQTGADMRVMEIVEITSAKTSDMNTADEQLIAPRKRTADGSDGVVKLKPHSVNRIKLQGVHV